VGSVARVEARPDDVDLEGRKQSRRGYCARRGGPEGESSIKSPGELISSWSQQRNALLVGCQDLRRRITKGGVGLEARSKRSAEDEPAS
jgi:hypothetical protein